MAAIVIRGWGFISAALWLGLAALGLHFWPPSWWVEVGTVHIEDSRAGEPIHMVVTREIKREYIGSWVVSIRRWEGGWVTHCSATSATVYYPDAKLPKDLTLAWWTQDQCSNLPVGKYYASTAWTILLPGLLPDKQVIVGSNVFEVRP